MEFQIKERYQMDDLKKIMALLRGENGCPWDREQTHQSIRKNFLEETYEVLEAIDEEDATLLQEELGDVLLQVVFHSRIEEEQGNFDFDDVVTEICNKLIIRHPHVFGDGKADDADTVLQNWDQIKKEQKQQSTYTETLHAVPKLLPALMRSEKVQHRAARSGFEYPDVGYALKDLKSEVTELARAVKNVDLENIEEEIGDVLFSCVNISRFFKIDSEKSLTKSIEKFINRFGHVEKLALEQGIDLALADLDTLNFLWNQAKNS